MKQALTQSLSRSKFHFLAFLLAAIPAFLTAQVQVTVTGTNVTCFGDCDGTATALASGGWAPYTYQWSNGATTSTITGLCPGTYSVTVVDIDLGSAVGSITISQPTQLGVNVNGQSQICGNIPDGWAAAVPFGGTPPYTYLWSNGGTTPQINNLVAGTYTVTVTDSHNCTTEGSFVVGFWNEGIWLMTSHADITCFGFNNGTAHVSVMSGTPPYTYIWSTGAVTQDITGLGMGTYTVTVSDANGCSNETSVSILEPDQIICSAGATPANCGLLGTATASATGGTPPYTYLWNPTNLMTPMINAQAGSYSVTITDANGCPCSTSVIVEDNNTSIIVTVTPESDAGCLIGGSATATASGGSGNYSYLWDSNPPQNTQTATNLSAGIHNVTVTDLTTGCQGVGMVNIPSSTPLDLTTTVIADATCLVGGSASVTASGGTPPYTYDWSNNGSQNPDTDPQTMMGLLAGPYSVTVTDSTGCTAVAMVTIGQTQGPSVVVTVDMNATCVAGGSATATASGGVGPYTYLWSFNSQTTQTATNLPPGTHTVTVTDANGCMTTGSVTITQTDAPDAIISSSTPSACASNSGSATVSASGGTGPYTYDWSNDGPDDPDNDPATVTGLGAGTYTVTVTDAAGCTATAQVSIAASLPPTVVITAVMDADCSTPGSATASVSGGTGPFDYLWDNGETTATATNLMGGQHSVTVTDANGCMASDTVDVGSNNTGIKIGDFVWYDDNQDGWQQPFETGVPNVSAMLITAGADGLFGTPDDVIVDTTSTDGTGHYCFFCVTPGTYVIMFTGIPNGFQWTIKDGPNNDCKDSDVKQNGKTDPFTITAGQGDDLCIDGGIHTICENLIHPGSICCNQTICEGETPDLIFNSLSPFGGSGPIQYVWMQFISIGGAPPQWVVIPGANSSSYQPGPLFETTRFMRCARREGCDHFLESNYVEITVLPAGSPGCTNFTSNFTVVEEGPSSVKVTWTTLPELTEYMYTVQHSTNMVQWVNLGSQIGKQDPVQENAYTYMHETPVNGKNFYRIKRATASGQIAFSDQRQIEINLNADQTVRITPNPVVDKLKIMNLLQFDSDVTVTITSTKGDVLHTVTLEKGKMEEIELQVTDLPSGIYMARIRFADGSIKTVKITKI